MCEIYRVPAGGKRKARIISHIGDGKPRFNQLRDILENVSPRMLAKQLRELEEDGLVIRKMHREIPPRVEYELTKTGRAFIPILDNISDWVIEYCPDAAQKIE